MDRFDRIYDLHKILSAARYPVSRHKLEQELECSRATVKRIIESMRLYLNAPIRYDRKLNGYIYDRSGDEPMYELPGIWFNASELHALLSVHQLLADVQPGLLEKQLAPLQERIEQLLNLQQQKGEELVQRIRILQMAARPAGEWFQEIAGATASRRQIEIRYYNRSRDDSSERTLSPQRLVHYRDNWYLDAWCHLREDLRTFALDSIESVRTRDAPAKSLSQEALDEHYSSAYGIFSGKADSRAVLRFDAERARWVSKEQWHPRQQAEWLDDGRFQLTVPYGNPTELVMDILRHGRHVEVLEPESLRRQVAEEIGCMQEIYARFPL
ncbi:MAG: WYL domain-containing transcriptional regulator [Gammaproteobacteria bacterium]|jgi:proteasome accessory factor C